MNPAAQLLQDLATRGIVVLQAGTALHVYPRAALDSDLLGRLQTLKPQILELLRTGAVVSSPQWRILDLLARRSGLLLPDLARALGLPPLALHEPLQTLLLRSEIHQDRHGRLHLNVS